MRKWAVIYSSASGNTKTIAEEIATAAGADLFPIQNAPTISPPTRLSPSATGYGAAVPTTV